MDVWETFWMLHDGRDYTEAGPMAFRLTEIKAHCELFPPIRPIKDLVSLVYALDREYLLDYSEKEKKKDKKVASKNGRHNRKRRS